MYPVDDHSNWMEFYPDTGKVVPKDLSPEKGPRVRMTVYVDADHAHDLVIWRTITGILDMLVNTPIIWISKRHNKAEKSNYGSESVASRVATELLLEIGYMLRSLGLALDRSALMLG
jgi:hypothetical protein